MSSNQPSGLSNFQMSLKEMNAHVSPTLLNFFGQTRGTMIDIPTDDDLIKARLIELKEPMICFAETTEDRRARLVKVLEQRGITQGMPTTALRMKKKKKETITQDDVNQPFYYQPDPEKSKALRGARKWILEYSLNRAKQRIGEVDQWKSEYESKWQWHENEQKKFKSNFDNFSITNSTVGDETRPLSSVNFSPCGNYFATSSWSGLCKMWDRSDFSEVRKFVGHEERAQQITYYPEERDIDSESLALISCGADCTIRFWSMNSDTPLLTLKGHTDCVNKTAFHPSLRWLGSTSFDKSWSLWDIESGKEILTQEGHSRPVYGIAFQNDGALVATGGLDSLGRIWDLRSGKPIWTLRGHARQILDLDWSLNGYQVASASDDQTVRIWDIRKRGTSYIIPAHFHLISSIKYQPTFGNYLITSSFDKTVRLWSTRTYELIKTFYGHESRVTGVAFPPTTGPYEGPNCMITTSSDRTWKYWESNASMSDLDQLLFNL